MWGLFLTFQPGEKNFIARDALLGCERNERVIRQKSVTFVPFIPFLLILFQSSTTVVIVNKLEIKYITYDYVSNFQHIKLDFTAYRIIQLSLILTHTIMLVILEKYIFFFFFLWIIFNITLLCIRQKQMIRNVIDEHLL